jgi:hypothetical protein
MEHVKLFGMNVMRIKYYFKMLIKHCNQFFNIKRLFNELLKAKMSMDGTIKNHFKRFLE